MKKFAIFALVSTNVTVLPTYADLGSPVEITLVTATHSEIPLRDSLAPATVFTRADIERTQAKNLTELLSLVPGVDLVQNGGYGANASVYLRGTNSDHTLFLIDGQRFSSATLGNANFQFITPEHIDRIEIVRGPRSSIYGSDAIGGVIQIFTRRGSDKPEGYIRTGMGSHKTYETTAGGSITNNGFHVAANLSYFDTDGIDSFEDDTPPNNDKDGYRNRTISLNTGYSFTDRTQLNLNYLHIKAREEHDGTFTPGAPFSKNWIQTIQIAFNSGAGLWSTEVTLGLATDDSDNIDRVAASGNGHFRTTRESADWINTFQLVEHQLLTLGLESYEDEVKSSTEYTDSGGSPISTRYNHAGFAVYQFNHNLIDLQLGLRQDDNEEFGEYTTANASFGIHIGDYHQIIASYGEGFKAPTFNDLYWPISAFSFGNPDLKSEESESYELEFRGRYSMLNWALSTYKTKVENLIDWAPITSGSFVYTPSNVSAVTIEGIEFSTRMTVAGLDLAATASYIDATDDESGNQLTNRAKKNATLVVDKSFDRLTLGSTLRAYSKRYSDLNNSTYAPGYAVIDVYTRYNFTDHFSGEFKINNILDREYQSREGYFQDDINWFVSMKYTL